MSKISEHTQAKQQWLAERLKNFDKKQVSFGITPQSRPPNLPLSFAQQRLWFLEQLEPGSTAYLLSYAWRLQGPLDAAALEASLAKLVTRHESLRTIFTLIDEQPVQVIAPVASISLPLCDLTALPEEARDAELTRWLEEEPHRPFDLATGPLWRGQLLRLGSEEHALLLTIHHIITDGWSMGIMFKEFSTLYTAQVTGQPATLPPLPLQYADFAIWQRQWLQGDMLDRQLTYWRTQLAEAPPYLVLPTDSPRPLQQTYRGDQISFTLPPTLTRELKRISQQEGVTLFMTLLAAFQILLARYTSQRDILVGTPIAGRTHTELEGLIGFFVNTMVLRTQFKGQPTFRDLLQQVRDTCLDAYSHQDLPFEKLVEALQPVRDPSRHPIFQVMFQLHHATLADNLEFPHLQVESLSGTSQTAKFDLALSLISTGENVQGKFTFNTDLFDLGTMTRLAKHYQLLLESLTANPGRDVFQLPLLTEAERHQLLVEWNPPISYQDISTPCVHHLFEAQAARTPDAVAVVCENQQVTYRELNDRANQLAQYLLAQGVGSEIRVGICLERGLELLISLVGILKAGGAYVPIDPTTPTHRIAKILSDAQVLFVLTQAAQLQVLPQTHIPLVKWETLGPQLSHQTKANPMAAISSDQLAYLIYTSGSTGTPKGIAISHGALQNHMNWMQKTFAFSAEDRVLQKTSISFDASVWECWMPLITGSSLVMAESEDARDLARLVQRMRRHQITHLQMVPSILTLLLQEPDLPACRSLRHLFSGGEALSHSLQQQCYQTLPVSLHNLYGPTETTIDITAWTCQPSSPLPYVPIGRPITNAHIFLLDSFHQIVPIGVVGEMFAGGAPLSRGYWQQPALTAERFHPNPFSDKPGERLYRTGDFARLHADGTLEYLGRLDHQVKLRGFRIELGEIESVLAQHPGVQNAVVLCREDIPSGKRLVAYVVSTPETSLDPETLRTHLKTRLPDYMRPAVFVTLDELPLTSNGKINRQTLPTPDQTHHTRATTSIPPRTSMEELLAEIWQDLLKVDYIGVHDNFFDLGGHSLLATQVMARTRALFRTEVSIRTLFEGPTIAQLGATLQTARTDPAEPLAPSFRPFHHPGLIPVSFAQKRLWFLEQWEPGSTAYLVPYAWRLRGALNIGALTSGLEQLAARHASLRTSFSVVDGQPIQVIAPMAPLSLQIRELPQSAQEVELQRLIHEESQQPFDLTTGPLWRTHLLRLGPEDHVFLLTLHHIITDGWSMKIFLKELMTLYKAHIAGQPTELAPLPLQYADFAIWQRQWLQGEALERQLTYWRKQLADAPPSLALPTDTPRPPQQTYRGEQVAFTLSPQLTQALKTLSQQEGVTLFMTLLAAFQVLLFRYTGQRDILVGTPIAGRTHTELEGLLGFFVNTLVLRTQFTGHPTFRDLLRQVHETCLDAYAHQDLPFEKLVEALQPVRDPSRHPLFQVMFQLHHRELHEGLLLPHVQIEAMSSNNHKAKFDLLVALVTTRDSIHGSVTFNTDLFSSDTMNRLAAHYQVLLDGLVAEPSQAVSHLPLLTSTERQQLLVDWNETAGDSPPNPCVHELFERQVARTPEAIAVVFDDQHLTYAALNARANQLAHFLIAKGVMPEVRVGICLERSLELAISLLGVIKAGGAYVPLDPNYPPERLSLMLKDSQTRIVLTHTDLQSRIPQRQALNFYLDQIDASLACVDSNNPIHSGTMEQMAYVIFTSGSTGRPKGVAVCHRTLVNLIVWQGKTRRTPANGTTLQFASLSFDVSSQEIFSTWCAGGRLQVISEGTRIDFPHLLDTLNREMVDRVFLPFVALQSIAAFSQENSYSLFSLSEVITAGEQLKISEAITQLFSQLPNSVLVNHYGPTESHVVSSYELGPPPHEWPILPPIGRPIDNTQLYLLNAYFEPVPLRATGELYIGGIGLARCYLNRPDLTAERFIPSPYSPGRGARVYRTGDLARYRPDGALEFMGRADHQVKIRGYRIECGEIETILTSHPTIREVLVLPREDGMGNKRLVAYISLERGSIPNISEFRDFLSLRLPAFMIPTGFVFLDTFPLNSNGKIDRHKLPLETQQSSQEKATYVAPRNSLESQLTKIWETVLGKQPIGVTDNFFNLGGESLMAVRLCSEMERVLLRKISVPLIFHAQTIEQLAKIIGHGQKDSPSSLMIPIQASGSNPPIFCVLLGATFLPYMKNYPNQPLYMFFNQSHDGRPAIHTTVEEIAKWYLKDLRLVQPNGPYYLAGYSFGGMVAYEMAQQLCKEGETIAFLALVDPTTPQSPSVPTTHRLQLHRFLARTMRQEKRWLSNGVSVMFRKTLNAIQWRMKSLHNIFMFEFKKMACTMFHIFHYPLPMSLRQLYRERVALQAARQYIPQNYPGLITLFQTKKDLESYWGKLCAGLSQVYDCSTRHGEMVDESNAEKLLHQLMDCLEKAKKKP